MSIARALTWSLIFGLALALLPVPANAQRGGFIRDAEIETLLADYARPIFRAAGLDGGRIRVRIIHSKAFNAFVLDGRNIFINTGVLQEADTPNEVIGVIAHESGHIAGGHLAGLRAKIKRDQTRLLLLKILGIGAVIAGAASGDQATREAAGGIGKGIFAGSDPLIMRSILSYRRVQESAADQAALAYLNATRQSARGMLVTFERFAKQEVFSATYQDPYVRSHPMGRARLAQLREAASRSPYYGRRDPPELQLRHDLMRAKLSGYLERPRTVFNRYPSSDRSLPARYARAIATYFASGIDRALPAIEALIRARPTNPYFWELKGDLLLRSGRAQAAIAPLRKANRLTKGKAPLIKLRLAQALLAAKDKRQLDEAIRLLRNSLVVERSALGYRQLASAYWRKRRPGDAYLASAQAYLIEGKLKDAKRFAKRAQAQFPRGSASWIKADDILKFSPSG